MCLGFRMYKVQGLGLKRKLKAEGLGSQVLVFLLP